MQEITELFVKFSTIKNPKETSGNDFKVLEKFFVLFHCVSMNVKGEGEGEGEYC